MTVQEAGQKASKMDSKQIGASIEYLKSRSSKAGAVEKANIEKLIQKLERKKKAREMEEKAKADHAEDQRMMEKMAGYEDDESLSEPGPNADPTPTPKAAEVTKAKVEDEDAWMYVRGKYTLSPGHAETWARTSKKEKVEKYIGALEGMKEKAKADPYQALDLPMYDRVIEVLRKHLESRKKFEHRKK